MSQGTPSREGRIERHLMRQRGAGVRTITADFGFSFALPTAPAIAQLDLPTEPPNKRRKTIERTSPKRCNPVTTSTLGENIVSPAELVEALDTECAPAKPEFHPEQANHGEKIVSTVATLPTEKAPKPSKKPARVRRKLCLEDDVEHKAESNIGEQQNGGLEDTFMFGVKPKKRQPRRKAEEEAVPAVSKETSMKAPTAGKKTTKARPQVADEPVPDPSTELPAKPVLSEEKVEEAPAREALKNAPKKAPTKGKKSTKAKQHVKDELVPDIAAEPLAKPAIPQEKPKATRRKPVAKGQVEIIQTDSNAPEELPMTNEPDAGSNGPAEPVPVTIVMNEEVTNPESKPVKAKAAAKKGKKRSIDEVAASVEAESTPTPEKAAKRPRRQAAISAIEKVTLGYEEELISVDKLRRAPEVANKSRKSRKADVCESSAVAQPNSPAPQPISATEENVSCGTDEPPFSPPLTVKRGQNTAVKTAKLCNHDKEEEPEALGSQAAAPVSPPPKKNNCSVEAELPALQKLPAKRGRKPGAKALKANTTKINARTPESALEDEAENAMPEKEPEASPKLPAKRGRKPGVKASKATPAIYNVETPGSALADAGDNAMAEEELGTPRIAPAKRGRKPGWKAAKATCVTTNEGSTEPAPAETLTVSESKQPDQTRSMLRSAKEDGKGAKISNQPVDPHEPVEDKPKKTRRALADFDGNIVRHTSAAAFEKPLQPAGSSTSLPVKSKESSRGDRSTRPVKPKDISRDSKAQTAQQRTVSPNEPSNGTPTSSRKRHVIAAEEDLDWLFEKPETKRSRHTATRHPTSKTRRKEAEQSAKDMDLDDLLASIAGFSGKLLTGKRGRAVAT